jgi:hypothetical protein
MTMLADVGIEEIGEMRKKIGALRAEFEGEAKEIEAEWFALGQLGAKRADHAAALLSRLRPHLREMARYCAACEAQIDSMVADPFGVK